MSAGLVFVFLLGVAVGCWIGRRLAEQARAVADMRRTWTGRRSYRKK